MHNKYKECFLKTNCNPLKKADIDSKHGVTSCQRKGGGGGGCTVCAPFKVTYMVGTERDCRDLCDAYANCADYDFAEPNFGTCTMYDACIPSALDRHNEFRAKHQVPDLEWDVNLQKDAQAVADTCKFEHSRGIAGIQGENLWIGQYANAAQAVTDWYNELTNPGYDFNDPGFSSGTGHFTQIVWKSTTKVACAVKSCTHITGYATMNNAKLFVCRYSPPGNLNTKTAFRENVQRPMTTTTSTPAPGNPASLCQRIVDGTVTPLDGTQWCSAFNQDMGQCVKKYYLGAGGDYMMCENKGGKCKFDMRKRFPCCEHYCSIQAHIVNPNSPGTDPWCSTRGANRSFCSSARWQGNNGYLFNCVWEQSRTGNKCRLSLVEGGCDCNRIRRADL
jgi:hypothetical protein